MQGRALTTFHFRNRTLQEYLHQKLSSVRQQKLHKRAGEYLETFYGDHWSDAAAALSLHFRFAKDAEKALRYTIEAGKKESGWPALTHFRYAKELLKLIHNVDDSLIETIYDEERGSDWLIMDMEENGTDHYGCKLKVCMTPEELEEYTEKEEDFEAWKKVSG